MTQALAMLALMLATPEGRTAPVPAHRARANLARLISNNDYPVGALRRGAEGRAAFRLLVAADGVPAACKIEQSSGDAELDRTSCALIMARARFEPARDKAGREVPDIVHSSITWRLANPEPGELSPQAYVQILRLGPGGPQCSSLVNGQVVAEASGSDCPPAPSVDAPPNARVQWTLVNLFVPDGSSAPPVAPGDYGELQLDYELQLTIAPDGHLSDCQVTSLVGAMVPDRGALCTQVTSAWRFPPNPRPDEMRRGRLESRTYLRIQP